MSLSLTELLFELGSMHPDDRCFSRWSKNEILDSLRFWINKIEELENGDKKQGEEMLRLEGIKARHVLNNINRICRECGEDMCGPDHSDCYACENKRLREKIEELECLEETEEEKE